MPVDYYLVPPRWDVDSFDCPGCVVNVTDSEVTTCGERYTYRTVTVNWPTD